MTQLKTWLLVGALALPILDGCGTASPPARRPAPKTLPSSINVLDIVTEGLGSVALKAALSARPRAEAEDATSVREALEPLIQGENSPFSDLDYWQIHVVESERADAVAFAGGGLLITSALLRCPADLLRAAPHTATDGCAMTSADENARALPKVLAVVLSHEISHLAERHFLKRLKANGEGLLNQVVNQVFKEIHAGKLAHDPAHIQARVKAMRFSAADLRLLSAVAGVTVGEGRLEHPFQEEQELAADCHGAELMSNAGHDPRDALRFWRNHRVRRSEGSPYFLRSHPPSRERQKQLRACIRDRSLRTSAVARRAN